jgi:hypothetical protein
MDMGTATGPEGWRTGQASLLSELYNRTQLAQSQLGSLIDGYKKFFFEKSETIIDVFDLPVDKANTLRDFADKLVNLLETAYPQVEERLQKLLKALENSNVKVELGPRARKSLHVIPEGERWYVEAYFTDMWSFIMPIHGISDECEFPDILNMSYDTLYQLWSGWRASDESFEKKRPKMETGQTWQIFAWAATRPGLYWIYLYALKLNKRRPNILWILRSKSWEQQWPGREGKKQAQAESNHPLSKLTWYLGDGCQRRGSPAIKIGKKIEPISREEAQQIIQATYLTCARYGKLLDLLAIKKWELLKSFINQKPKNPIHVVFKGYKFCLNYYDDQINLNARALFKDPAEAHKLAKALAEIGIESKIYTLKTGYHILSVQGRNVLKLAEGSSEWRKALKKLAEKHKLRPRGPVTRRLLELAENPPQARHL